jgi:hypothetical protein
MLLVALIYLDTGSVVEAASLAEVFEATLHSKVAIAANRGNQPDLIS